RLRPRAVQHHQVLHGRLPRAHQDHRQRDHSDEGARGGAQVRPAGLARLEDLHAVEAEGHPGGARQAVTARIYREAPVTGHSGYRRLHVLPRVKATTIRGDRTDGAYPLTEISPDNWATPVCGACASSASASAGAWLWPAT